jgi:hypothetical protein
MVPDLDRDHAIVTMVKRTPAGVLVVGGVEPVSGYNPAAPVQAIDAVTSRRLHGALNAPGRGPLRTALSEIPRLGREWNHGQAKALIQLRNASGNIRLRAEPAVADGVAYVD